MSDSSTLNSIIKSPTRIVQTPTAPVIVVGLPRSGSSYITHVLSCLEGWFVFDDLYPYQKSKEFGLSPTMDLSQHPEQLKGFIHSLTWQLRAKIKFEENFQVPDLTWDDTFEMEEQLLNAFEPGPLTWMAVLEEWLMRLALHAGQRRWGYKTPQDFLNMDELMTLFPGVKFIYILRDPRKMMRSFKNLPKVKTHGTQDGESGQYHPLVYALYWNKAYERVNDFIRRGKAPVETVKFEDLVKTPEAVADRLAQFLDTRVVGNVVLEKGNTSFTGGSAKELTNTEVAICEAIARQSMQAAGYELKRPLPSPLDIFDFLGTTFSFTLHQLKRLGDKRARHSIVSFLKSLIGKKS
ncbi:MAG: sulfotransferase [Cyanobacteria bacterium P01_G01_bin.54]